MKIIIDTEVIKDRIEHEWGYEGIRDDLDEIFEKHGTPIPDNATNGDMIKAMFPDAKYKHIKTMSGIDGMEVNGINGLYDNLGQWCARDVFFYDDFWNAPYKRGE